MKGVFSFYKVKIGLISSILLLCSTIDPLAKNVTLLWDYETLKNIKTNTEYYDVKKECVDKANSLLSLPPVNIMDKTWSFNDDFHYYATMAGYWWPEEKNGKIVYVRHDGKSYPGANDLDMKKIKQMAERLQYLSLAYFFTHRRKYIKAYKRQLDTWFLDPETYMYPNFEYAQVIPGKNEVKGRAVGLIEAHPFNTILESLRLMESMKIIKGDRKIMLVKWFSDFAEWMTNSELGIKDRNANSNQAVSYDITLLNIAEYVGREDLVKQIIEEFPTKRILVQIKEDGKMPAELARTNAYSYSLANLNFFAQFCIIAKSLGIDVYQQNKDRLEVALNYITSFIDSPEDFPYQQINGWKSAKYGLQTVTRRFKIANSSIDNEQDSAQGWYEIKSIDDLMFLQ